MSDLPRCGDHVHHLPTNEDWVVAWAEGEDLAWAGWPNSIDRVADCVIIKRCSDEEHAKNVQKWRDNTEPYDSRRTRVLRLYGGIDERRIKELEKRDGK